MKDLDTDGSKPSERGSAVVVTGGSRGIGLAIARRFAKAGHTIVLVARHREALDAAAAELRTKSGVRVVTLALDVTEPDAPHRIDAALEANGLACDVLVNNAGIGLSGRFDDHSHEKIEALLALNVTALTRLMRHVLPQMRARGRGGVLNIASLGGYVPGPHQAVYYASKAYVISLSEAVASELAGTGVRVAVVAPGPVATGFHEAMGAESARYRAWLPQMTPERVARSAYRGLKLGRSVIVPGFLNTAAAYALRALPHPIAVTLVGWLLSQRTESAAKSPQG